MPAAVPSDDVAVPAAVLRLAGRRALKPLWRNELSGLTFRIGDDVVVKWSPPSRSASIDLFREAERLLWAAPYATVPRVLDTGSDDEGSWMLTERLPGESAVSTRWLADPATAVRAIGEGLRALHDRLPVTECPFEWSARSRLAGHPDLSALDPWRDPPPDDVLVVCHGDACAPNTLIGEDGRWLAHVDLGSLGVGDRWSDLAIATYSTQWNYGEGWEDALLEAYGVGPDDERTTYYRALWDLEPEPSGPVNPA